MIASHNIVKSDNSDFEFNSIVIVSENLHWLCKIAFK